jgi:hypothetical protein
MFETASKNFIDSFTVIFVFFCDIFFSNYEGLFVADEE